MLIKGIFLFGFMTLSFISVTGQQPVDSVLSPSRDKVSSINGFVRGGFYGYLDKNAAKPVFSSGYSDLGLKFLYSEKTRLKGFADIRLRYGAEFGKAVSYVNIHEAYAEFSIGKLNVTAGQKIIKLGRADITNPTSKLNPQNFVIRSPDREDMDMGNLLASVTWAPARFISFQGIFLPFYRSSVLIIDPVKLPENVTINQIKDLMIGEKMASYGLRTDIHAKGIDAGLSWFEGYDPMPGIALSNFTIDLSGPIPVTSTTLNVKPYKTRMLGADFETSIGSVGLRGEAAWTVPYLSFQSNEFVPLPEIKYVFGLDFSLGNFRITGEYNGKYITDFTSSPVDPILGTEPDLAKLAVLLATPGFDINEYVRQQVGAFNRLYNYQIDKVYHSAGVRIEGDLLYGRVLPSIFGMYNFTSRDLLVIPEIRFKPTDGLTITAGADIYSGKKGSLFDIVDVFMSSVYFGIRIDF